MDDSRTIVPKIVFLLITWERVFFFIKYGTKWSFSVKVGPIVPSSEFLKMSSFLSGATMTQSFSTRP